MIPVPTVAIPDLISYEICVTPIAEATNDMVASDTAEPTTILLLLPPNDLPKSMISVDANDTCLGRALR